jgi:hypothetical protein
MTDPQQPGSLPSKGESNISPELEVTQRPVPPGDVHDFVTIRTPWLGFVDDTIFLGSLCTK